MIARLFELARAGETTLAQHRFAILLITVSSIAFSFSGLLLREIQAANVWQINFYRSIAQTLVVFVLIAAVNRGALLQLVGRVGRYGVLAALLQGILPICFIVSMSNTTVANTLFVISAVPVITALLAWVLLGERVRPSTRVAIAVAMAGIAVMMAEGMAVGSLFGNAMALATALLFSIFAVIVRAHRAVNMLPTIGLGSIVTCVICFAVTGHDLTVSLHDLVLCLIWGAVIAGLFGNILFIAAARHLAAAEVTLLMLTEFVLGPVWVWLFVNEVPTAYTLLGGAVVLSAVTGRALADLRRGARRPPPPKPLP